MIQLFCVEDDHLRLVEQLPAGVLPENALWIDLFNPTAEEAKTVESWSGARLPTSETMVEIEESSRFYMEKGVHYLTAPILHTIGHHRSIAPVSFVLAGKLLVTVRYSEPKAIALYVSRASKAGNDLIGRDCTGLAVMLGIMEAVTDRIADFLEATTAEIDAASHTIFHRPPNQAPISTREFRKILTHIGGHGTTLSKARESLSGLSRLLAYASMTMTSDATHEETKGRIESLERDARSLENYVDFLANKITFLLDTIVGLISVEQSAIIKIFSVAAVGFMPPTLIASIYGMNFSSMPELNSWWGYPMAIILMVLSAVLPLFYFRRKGWL